jgi:protein TonB
MGFYFSIYMKRLLLLLLVLSGFIPTVYAQQPIPLPKKEFLDSTFIVLPSEAGARYYRETVYTDSIGGTVKQYYLSGKLHSSGTFDHIRKTIAHGTLTTWYESGQLQYQATFVHNTPVEAFGYYPTGQLKRHELYVGKKRKVAQCFAEDGQKLRFFEFSILPIYPEGNGGEHAIIVAVMHNTIYPQEALRRNITGRVTLSFAVTPIGTVADIKVTQSAHPLLDAAAVQAVQQLKRFKPGQEDGKPVRVGFTIPVNFAIK